MNDCVCEKAFTYQDLVEHIESKNYGGFVDYGNRFEVIMNNGCVIHLESSGCFCLTDGDEDVVTIKEDVNWLYAKHVIEALML